jgi:hypothetical protein
LERTYRFFIGIKRKAGADSRQEPQIIHFPIPKPNKEFSISVGETPTDSIKGLAYSGYLFED